MVAAADALDIDKSKEHSANSPGEKLSRAKQGNAPVPAPDLALTLKACGHALVLPRPFRPIIQSAGSNSSTAATVVTSPPSMGAAMR